MVSLIRDRHLRPAPSQLHDLFQGSWKGVPVILVRFDIQSSYDDPASLGAGNRHLASKLILLVVLAFGHTVHMGFMDAVNLVLAIPFLAQDLFKDLQFLLIGFKTFRWKLSLQLP